MLLIEAVTEFYPWSGEGMSTSLQCGRAFLSPYKQSMQTGDIGGAISRKYLLFHDEKSSGHHLNFLSPIMGHAEKGTVSPVLFIY